MALHWPLDIRTFPMQQQALLSTVMLQVQKPTGMHVGTGFFVALDIDETNSFNAIITNRHVLQNATKVGGLFRRRTPDHIIIDEGVRVEISPPHAVFIDHPSPAIDLAAIILPPVEHLTMPDGSSVAAIQIPESLFVRPDQVASLQVGEEVFVIGYPVGLHDTAHNLPIARRGTLATTYSVDFGGRPEVVLDVGAYKGSSGSPVFVMNDGVYSQGQNLIAGTRFMLLGLVWGGQTLKRGAPSAPQPIPTAAAALDDDEVFPLNLAYCIKASELLSAKAHFIQVLRGMGKLATP